MSDDPQPGLDAKLRRAVAFTGGLSLAVEGVPVGQRLREIAGTEAPSGVFTDGPNSPPDRPFSRPETGRRRARACRGRRCGWPSASSR